MQYAENYYCTLSVVIVSLNGHGTSYTSSRDRHRLRQLCFYRDFLLRWELEVFGWNFWFYKWKFYIFLSKKFNFKNLSFKFSFKLPTKFLSLSPHLLSIHSTFFLSRVLKCRKLCLIIFKWVIDRAVYSMRALGHFTYSHSPCKLSFCQTLIDISSGGRREEKFLHRKPQLEILQKKSNREAIRMWKRFLFCWA